jgi:membrane-bound ClpP family serine protease
MAQAGQNHGQNALLSDFKAHADTYRGFLGVVAWVCLLIAIAVTLLVVAFAMGFGWFAVLGVALDGVDRGLFGKLMYDQPEYYADLYNSYYVR